MSRLAALAALCLLAVGAPGQPLPSGGAGWGDATSTAPESPDQIVRRGVDRLAGFLAGAGDPSPESIREFLAREIAPSFDFAYMARWAAGPLHRRLDPEQRARFAARLETMFVGALARNLGSFARPFPAVDVAPARAGSSPSEASVWARVMTGFGPPTRLEFRCYWDGGAWRVFDVAANGASAVAYYRGYFANLLRRHGPDALFE